MSQMYFETLDSQSQNPSLSTSDFVDIMLRYAPNCSDQSHIYSKIEQHQIANGNPLFWLSRCRYSIKQRRLNDAYTYLQNAKTSKRLNTNDELTIQEQEDDLISWLKDQLKIYGYKKNKHVIHQIVYHQEFDYYSIQNENIFNQKLMRSNTLIGRLIDLYDQYCQEEKQTSIRQHEQDLAKRSQSWVSKSVNPFEFRKDDVNVWSDQTTSSMKKQKEIQKIEQEGTIHEILESNVNPFKKTVNKKKLSSSKQSRSPSDHSLKDSNPARQQDHNQPPALHMNSQPTNQQVGNTQQQQQLQSSPATDDSECYLTQTPFVNDGQRTPMKSAKVPTYLLQSSVKVVKRVSKQQSNKTSMEEQIIINPQGNYSDEIECFRSTAQQQTWSNFSFGKKVNDDFRMTEALYQTPKKETKQQQSQECSKRQETPRFGYIRENFSEEKYVIKMTVEQQVNLDEQEDL